MTLTTYFSVASQSDLRSALAAIDVGGVDSAIDTNYLIVIATDLSLASDTPAITLAPGDTLSVQGGNTDNLNLSAVIDGGGARGFVVNSGTVTFSNLSLTALTARGGSGVPDGGGAIRVGGGASVTASAVTFTGDSASGGTAAGGAVFVAAGGTFSMLGGSISGGGRAVGNAIFVQGNGTVTLDSTVISGSIADASGAGLGTGSGAVLALNAVTLAAGGSYAGGTTISGTLALGAPGAAGYGALTFAAPTGDMLVIGPGNAPSGSIDGFLPNPASGSVNSDVIDLQGIGLATAYALAVGNVLTVTGPAGSASLHLDPLHSYANDRFILRSDGGTDAAAGTLVTVVQAGFLVGSEADLNAALAEIDVGGRSAGPGASYTITFTASITLTTDLFAIDLAGASSVTVDGAGFTLDGAHTYRGFFDYAGGITLRNLTISNTIASGGAGGGGATPGGGGAGLGGGLFVAAGGTATLSGVNFSNDRAAGGAAGTGGGLALGGGGGLGGSGGAGAARAGGGGGIGVGASGGSSTGVPSGGVGIVLGAAGGYGGTGNRPAGGAGGAAGGGGGAAGTVVTIGSGRGGGGSRSFPGQSGSGGIAGFGGGAGSAEGAGFGGGGAGNSGGWGGGGSGPSAGGFGGGAGAAGGAGGGLGAGGDVFVEQGGALTILSGTLSGGTVAGGAGSNGGGAGAALGAGIFIQGDTGLSLAPAAGQTLRIADAIADASTSGGPGAGRLTVNGAGAVVLSADNTFSGGIVLKAGTLSLLTPGAAGSGAIAFAYGTASTLTIGEGAIPIVAISGFLPHDVIDLQKIGTATRATLGAGDVLTVGGGAVTVQLTLDPAQSFTGESFAVTGDGSGGTLLTAVDVAGDTPPSVSGTAFIAGDDHTPQNPLAGATVSDLDVGQTETVTLRLSAAANGRLSNLAGGSYDAATGTYTVSGSAGAVTAALDALVFTPTINQVAPGQVETTVFSLSVTDGLMVSTAASSTLSITALNDAPTIGGTATSFLEGYWNVPLDPFPAVTITDPNPNAVETATITLADSGQGPSGATDGNGALTSALGGVALTHTGVGTYSLAAASPAALTAAIRSLQLTAVPHPALPGYTITYVTLAVSDGIAPPVTASAEVLTGLPIFTGLVANQHVTDGGSLRPFSAAAVTDSAGLSVQGLTVILYDAASNYTAPTDANGTLSGAGLTRVGVGSYSVVPGTPTFVSAELDTLVFTAAAGSTATTFFELSAFDGATTSNNADTSVVATLGARVPGISGTLSGQQTSDSAPLAPFAGVSVTDANAAPSDSAAITLVPSGASAPSDAYGALAGVGLTHVASGVYALAATDPASLTAELRALVFTPTPHEAAPGQTVSTTFTLRVADGLAVATDSTTQVSVTATGLPSITLSPVAGTDFVNAATALAGFAITGTTTGVEDGQIASVAILAGTTVVTQYSVVVTDGAWSAVVTTVQARALMDGVYTVAALVTNRAGVAASPAMETFTVNLMGIVAATPIIGATTVAFGAARVGDAALSRSVSIGDSKTAVNDQAALSYAATLAAGPFALDATATGLVASGQTSSLHLGMSTAVAGSYSGTQANIALTSTGGSTTGLPDAGLPGAKLTLIGQVYAPAVVTLSANTLDFGIVHVGDSVSRFLAIGNSATGALTDVLTGGFGTLSGPFTAPVSLGTGVTSGKSKYLRVDLATRTAGSFVAAAPLTLASHDPALSDVGVAAGPVALKAVVDNYAVAAMEKVAGAGVLEQAGASYKLDLGTVLVGSAPPTVSLGVFNAASGLADALGGLFSIGGSTAFANSGFGAFVGLGAGQADVAPTVTLSTATAGTFTETITLRGNGSNASGYARSLPVETLTVTGTVTPAPAKAHIAASSLGLRPATFLAASGPAARAAPTPLDIMMPNNGELRIAASGLNRHTVDSYASGARIDITDLDFAHATVRVVGSGANTLLAAASGGVRTAFILTGAFSPSGFDLAPDGHTGSILTHE